MIVQSKISGRKQHIEPITWNTWGEMGIQHRFVIVDDNSIPQAQPTDIDIKKNKAALKEQDAGHVGEGDEPKTLPPVKEKTKKPYDTGRKKVN